MHSTHLLLEEKPIRMATILEPSKLSFFPATTKIVGTLGPKSRSVEVVSDGQSPASPHQNHRPRRQWRLWTLKDKLEYEVKQRNEVIVRLEEEILATNTLLSQRNLCLQDLQYGMNKVEAERDHLESMVVMLKEQLEMAQALVEENEAIATEAHQIAEGRKAYAEDKKEEVNVLERSVEEL